MSWPANGQKISATLLTSLVHSQLSVTVHWQLSVTLVSFLMLVRDWIRWTRVQIAKSAITGNDIRDSTPRKCGIGSPSTLLLCGLPPRTRGRHRKLDRRKFRTMLQPQWQRNRLSISQGFLPRRSLLGFFNKSRPLTKPAQQLRQQLGQLGDVGRDPPRG